MLTNIVKFIHLLSTLTLLGSTVYCVPLLWRRRSSPHFHHTFLRAMKILLLSALIALITGTLLIYPKHFTFHTPWIQAAYLLVVCFSVGIGMLVFLKKQQIHSVWAWSVVYLLLLGVLVTVVHDAVTKTTFLF